MTDHYNVEKSLLQHINRNVIRVSHVIITIYNYVQACTTDLIQDLVYLTTGNVQPTDSHVFQSNVNLF